MAHAGLASAFNAPTLLITDEEAKKIADASQRVARHYKLPSIASETKDWIGLIVALGTVYGPRITAAVVSRKKNPEPKPDDGPVIDQHGNVVNMQGGVL